MTHCLPIYINPYVLACAQNVAVLTRAWLGQFANGNKLSNIYLLSSNSQRKVYKKNHRLKIGNFFFQEMLLCKIEAVSKEKLNTVVDKIGQVLLRSMYS